MSGDNNESPRILNYLPSFLCQPMRIVNRVFRRVLDVGLSISETWTINDDSVRHGSDEPVPDPPLEADIEADTVDMDSFSNRVEDSNRVVHNRSRNVARRGRPFINVTKIGRSNTRFLDVGQSIGDTWSVNGSSTADSESVPTPTSMDLDSVSDHVEFSSIHVIRNRRNVARRARPFSNAARIGRLSRDMTRRRCSRRYLRHEHNMSNRTLFERSELYYQINSNQELEVATEVTLEGDEGTMYNIRWQNYTDFSNTSNEGHHQDFTENH